MVALKGKFFKSNSEGLVNCCIYLMSQYYSKCQKETLQMKS